MGELKDKPYAVEYTLRYEVYAVDEEEAEEAANEELTVDLENGTIFDRIGDSIKVERIRKEG